MDPLENLDDDIEIQKHLEWLGLRALLIPT